MSWLTPSVIATMTGTALLVFIYFYLYLQDRKRYLAIWAVSWSIYFTRFLFLLLMIMSPKNSILLIGNQIASLLSGIILLWGTYQFIEKKFPKLWIYSSGLGVVWIIISISWEFTFLLMSIPTFAFLAAVYIWTGLTLIKSKITIGHERSITGWAFVLWGIHKADYPFLRPVVWFAPWGYLLAALLEFAVALGMLLIYFQKTRNDLQASEEKFRSFSEQSIVGVYLIKDNVFKYVNPKFAEIFGYTVEECLNDMQFYDLVQKDDVAVVEKHVRRRLSGEIKYIQYEFKGIKKSGEIIDIAVFGSSIVYDGKPAAIGTILDITVRKQTEMELQEKSQLLKGVIDSVQEGVIVYDRDMRYLIWNPFMERLSGHPASKVLGRHPLEVFPFLQETGVIERIEKAMMGETPPAVDFPYSLPEVDRSGWTSDTSSPLRNDEGEIIGVIGTVADITERKRSEEALKESEALTRAVLDNLPIGIAVNSVDPNVTFEFLNDNFTKFYQTSKEALADPDSFWDAVYEDPEFRNMIRKRVLDDCESGDIERMHWEDIPITRKGEETSFITARNIPIPDKQLMISVVWDVTERKKMETRLQQAQRMEAIGTLAGGIAHDFNNILFPIIGFAEMAQEDLPEDSPLNENINEILDGAKRARELVKQILTFSRQTEYELTPLKTQIIIKEVLKLIRSTLPSTIQIKQNISNACGFVMADATQIHQIAMNLITNAYHAMQKTGGKLKVSLEEVELETDDLRDDTMIPGRYVQLTVADSGHGMEQAIMERIFDPYFTTKGRAKGTGMGLAIVHGIVKSYGGDISVSSEVGKGTAFQVHLPLIKSDVDALEAEIIDPVKKGNERILFVDDEDQIVRMVKLMLERLGYHVFVRTSSTEALETFRASPEAFDLVITDMTMPDMTGVQLAQHLKKIKSDIPIIVCTGFSEQINEERIRAVGISDFVMKPVVKKDLAKAIRGVLDRD